MRAKVKILVEGYTNANEVGETGDEKDCPTITLVREDDLIMVVDPGILESQQILIDALDREGLTVEDVNMVCVTHSHLDHYRNVGMFPDAKVLEYFGVWQKNTVKDWSEQFTQNIQILRTPGHNNTDITLLVTTDDGLVAICGDVFWKENYPADPRDDTFASDPEKLKESREMVLKMADWIIPGHGRMYKIRKGQTQEEEKVEEGRTKGAVTLTCKRCHKVMEKRDRCLCRPWLCHHCCECGIDCDLCGCSHKR